MIAAVENRSNKKKCCCKESEALCNMACLEFPFSSAFTKGSGDQDLSAEMAK